MRYPILKKDDVLRTQDVDIQIDAEGIEIPERAPLTWNYDYTGGPYGYVDDIRLEDGEITGELMVTDPTWNDKTMEDYGYRLAGFYTDMVKSRDGLTITSCTLRAVAVVPPPAAYPLPKEN